METPRKRAIDVLLAREQRGVPVDQILADQQARIPLADPRDAQLAMALIYGVLRWQGYLDQVLADFSSHPLAKMKPLTLTALRVGSYQLLFLERVPASAAINETVQALKGAGQPKWLTGFVNGVLRAVDRNRGKIVPASGREAALLSHPAWLVARWRKRYGEAATAGRSISGCLPGPASRRRPGGMRRRRCASMAIAARCQLYPVMPKDFSRCRTRPPNWSPSCWRRGRANGSGMPVPAWAPSVPIWRS